MAATLNSAILLSAFGQEFRNLSFEWANGLSPTGQTVAISQALPCWTGYYGTNLLTTVVWNRAWLDTAGVAVLNRNSPYEPKAAAVTSGEYCASVFSGFAPNAPTDVSASISQIGLIPVGATNLWFNFSRSDDWGYDFVFVSFNGVGLPLSQVGASTNDLHVFSADVSAFAGQVGELRFTAPAVVGPIGQHWRCIFLMDNIRFPGFEPPFTWRATNRAVSITGYTGPGPDLLIPSYLDGLPVTGISGWAFSRCPQIVSASIPATVTAIGYGAFLGCSNLTDMVMANGIKTMGDNVFRDCVRLTSLKLPDSVAYVYSMLCTGCTSLTNVDFGDGVTVFDGFYGCPALTHVRFGKSFREYCDPLNLSWPNLTEIDVDVDNTTYASLDGVLFNKSFTALLCYPPAKGANYHVPDGVLMLGDGAFCRSTNLVSVYFQGNAPNVGGYVFEGSTNVTVYYLAGTLGWGLSFGGRPTALWLEKPVIQASPQTQTAEVASYIILRSQATNSLPMDYRWYFNDSLLDLPTTTQELRLAEVTAADSGRYTVVYSNALGCATSSPAWLSVIPAVERRPVPTPRLVADANVPLKLESTEMLASSGNWQEFDTVAMTSNPRWYFDLTRPLAAQRFYRASQTNGPSVTLSLDLQMIPALTLTGNVSDTIRVDGINQFGPTDPWFTLATVTLTNTTQYYFDITAPGQPPRLYRLTTNP